MFPESSALASRLIKSYVLSQTSTNSQLLSFRFITRLALCDLAGSERCSRTQNTGERLKEAGNINSSLLTLGKCISAIRLNQQSKYANVLYVHLWAHFCVIFKCKMTYLRIAQPNSLIKGQSYSLVFNVLHEWFTMD